LKIKGCVNIKCIICGNEKNNRILKIKEMMFGFHDVFDYLECDKCGCLQIINIPPDLGKYYPAHDYYSIQKTQRNSTIKDFFIKELNKYTILNNSIIGKLIYYNYPNRFNKSIGSTGINRESKLLDVGCGIGNLLFSLKDIGFQHLYGIEPFLDTEIIKDSLKIFNRTIEEFKCEYKFDLVIWRSSFEHTKNQLENLKKTSELMEKNGSAIISMPIKTDYIWHKYCENWVQIDAPRHLLIHTIKSFEILTKNTDLRIKKIIFDSFDFQFWGSEQYLRNIPLMSEKSYLINPKNSIFTKKDINQYKNLSKTLNKKAMGDKAIFILKHTN
jgi:2-polyprenyl-3-methyl-5-hydroxy-6-metoxy-1,4-benzoquinol methylase